MRGIDLLVRRLVVNTSGIQRQLLKIDKLNHTWKSSKTATQVRFNVHTAVKVKITVS